MKSWVKLVRHSVPTLSAVAFFAGALAGQEQKHLTVAIAGASHPSSVTANEIERSGGYPALIHLKGAVEIKTPVCLPVGPKGKLICDGSMILRADEATYNENSGKIDASGSVVVIPLFHDKLTHAFFNELLGHYLEIGRFFRKSRRVIVPSIVNEILEDQIVQKLA